ncbi:glycoside hydrolase superfamily [Thamnidium elegans]|nr:glycoside hydrolase superfamily [Thamnidium elegans]
MADITSLASFVSVNGTQFSLGDQLYTIRGANYWQGMNLGAVADYGGDRFRLTEELDQMYDMGINNLRVMAGSEGPDTEPYRMRPSMQYAPGQYNEDIFQGLDFLLDEMYKRNMTAVMTLNNFWQWSGGFAQYVSWITNETIPYPITDFNGFTVFTQQFYTNATIREEANTMFKKHISVVQNRLNTINGKKYTEDPTIMSWQIANEPQEGPKDWFEEIAKYIKEGSPNQLVSTGIESKLDEVDFLNAHESQYVDYCTFHCWVENWGEYNATDKSSLVGAQAFASNYLTTRSEWAMKISKPIVLEEFGMARDAWRRPSDTEYKYNAKTPTSNKDKYYKGLYTQIEELASQSRHSGSNFWAYGGLGRPDDKPNAFNMTWLGDPPHEPKGWYSVYNRDKTTLAVIKKHYKNLQKLKFD